MKPYRQSVTLFLKQAGIRANKKLGQHFLVDENIVGKTVRESGISANDTVVEIGPGFGILTEELVKVAGKIIAIEKDPTMPELLEKFMGKPANLELRVGDILKEDLTGIGKYSVVSNLPYNITAPVLRNFLEYPNPPEKMVLMIQKEVAERIVSDPPDSVLSFMVHYYSRPRILFYVSKKSFIPEPEVESAVVELIYTGGAFNADPKKLFQLVKAGFSGKRKQLVNSLSAGLGIENAEARKLLALAGIASSRRAESLAMDDWKSLYDSLK